MRCYAVDGCSGGGGCHAGDGYVPCSVCFVVLVYNVFFNFCLLVCTHFREFSLYALWSLSSNYVQFFSLWLALFFIRFAHQ